MLWEIPDDPRGALRWSLSKIRQIVDEDDIKRLDADRENVCLSAEGIEVDFHEVRQLRPGDVKGLDTERLEGTAGMFRGGFLEDLTLANCYEFEAWRMGFSNEMDLLRRAVLRELVGRLGPEEPERALAHAHALHRIDPEDRAVADCIAALMAAAGAARMTPVTPLQPVQPAAPKPVEAEAPPAAAPEPAPPAPPPEPTPTAQAPAPSAAAEPEAGHAAEPEATSAAITQSIRFCTSRDGTRIAFATTGSGPPLVRAPHWMTHLSYDWDSPIWRPLIDALSAQHTLVRFDQRCNGLSERNVEDVSFERMVDDLEAVVDAAGVQRFTLLGISQSCAVSVAYALRHPERVTGLILYGGYVKGWRKRADASEIAKREAMQTLIREGWGAGTPMFRQLFTSMFIPGANAEQAGWYTELQARSATPDDAFRTQRAMSEIDVSHLLPSVRCPTLVLHCTGDLVVPFSSGKAFAEGIANARFIELESDNHILLAEEPSFARFIDEVKAFVAETTAPPRLFAGHGERRQASVLSVELVSPLQAFDGAGADILAETLVPVMDGIIDVIESAGGEIVHLVDGDVTAVFGAEGGLEDHAFIACRCALQVREAVAAASGGAVRARIAVDCGDLLLRRDRRLGESRLSASGVPIQRTRQLVRAQRRDFIVLTSRAAHAAGGFVRTAPVPASHVVGLPRDIALRRLVGENRALSRWHNRVAQGLTPLAGRQAELLLLNQALLRVADGRGQVIGVVGEAGIGKSRLVHEFLASGATQNYTIIHAGAQESDAATPFAMVRKIVRSITFLEGDETRDVVAAKVESRLKALRADADIVSAVHFVLDLPGEEERWNSMGAAERAARLRAVVRQLIVLAAEQSPLACLLEDLHWLDEDSEAAVSELVAEVTAKPILLIATYRPEYHPPFTNDIAVSQLRLDPLSQSEAGGMLRDLLGAHPTMMILTQRILAAGDGVPLFVEEIVKALVEEGRIRGTRGDYRCVDLPAAIEIPPGVLNVITARIGRLAAGQQRLLEVAAAIGRDPPVSLLERILSLTPDEIDPLIDALRRAELVFDGTTSPRRVLTFKHALVRKAAYEALPRAARVMLHGKILSVLEASDFEEGDVEGLADHAERAEAWDKAATYLTRSARRAVERAANSNALAFVQRALRALEYLPEAPPRDRAELALRSIEGVALMATKGWGAPEVLDAFRRAEALCERLGDEESRFTVVRGLGHSYIMSGRAQDSLVMAERCCAMIEGRNDIPREIETAHLFWTSALFMGDYAKVRTHTERALHLYEPEHHHGLTFAYSGHDPGVCCRIFGALAATQEGRDGDVAAPVEAAIELAESFGHPLTTAVVYYGRSLLGLFKDDMQDVADWSEREVRLCETHFLPYLFWQGRFQMGYANARLGRRAEGVAEMDKAIDAMRAAQAELGLPYFLALRGEVHANAGESDKALARFDEAMAAAERNGLMMQYSEMLRMKGETLFRLGSGTREEGFSLMRAAVDHATGQRAFLPRRRAIGTLSRALSEIGRHEEADALAARADRPSVTGQAAE